MARNHFRAADEAFAAIDDGEPAKESDLVVVGESDKAMTTPAIKLEGLHSKSDIAAELAWRDAEIVRLRAIVSKLPATADGGADRSGNDVVGETI